jgi:hypothetical protein
VSVGACGPFEAVDVEVARAIVLVVHYLRRSERRRARGAAPRARDRDEHLGPRLHAEGLWVDDAHARLERAAHVDAVHLHGGDLGLVAIGLDEDIARHEGDSRDEACGAGADEIGDGVHGVVR